MGDKFFYERNQYLLDHETNKTFEEILWMSDDEFSYWCVEIRKAVVYSWDILGIPPRVGYNEQQIIEQFQEMESFQVNKFLIKDELTGEKDVIRNTHILGGCVSQWFSTMMKTPINYTDDVEAGKSIYDFFAKNELLDTFCTYARRHFKRDSFYAYSRPIQVGDKQYGNDLPFESDPVEWIKKYFHNNYDDRKKYSYWLAPVKEDGEYTGFNEELKGKQYLTLTRQQIEESKVVRLHHRTNVDYTKSEIYQIRVFELGQKIFPIGFKAWRVSFCQAVANFPPLTAKYIYQRFTEPFKDQDQIIIYDPSMGWGGRLLGAMSIKDDRNILYIGTDPNTDHNTTPGRTKYHELSDFYRENVEKGGMWSIEHTKTHLFQLGSEVIHENKDFQQYKGKLDLVLTSPPYFSKELYSKDETQSARKFTTYDTWRDGFLKPTLETCVEWLKPNRYLIWNISDAKFGNTMLPLATDSISILESLGMKYCYTLKLSLAQAPGGNRIDAETGIPKFKYGYKTNGMWLKYEPVLVFLKNNS